MLLGGPWKVTGGYWGSLEGHTGRAGVTKGTQAATPRGREAGGALSAFPGNGGAMETSGSCGNTAKGEKSRQDLGSENRNWAFGGAWQGGRCGLGATGTLWSPSMGLGTPRVPQQHPGTSGTLCHPPWGWGHRRGCGSTWVPVGPFSHGFGDTQDHSAHPSGVWQHPGASGTLCPPSVGLGTPRTPQFVPRDVWQRLGTSGTLCHLPPRWAQPGMWQQGRTPKGGSGLSPLPLSPQTPPCSPWARHGAARLFPIPRQADSPNPIIPRSRARPRRIHADLGQKRQKRRRERGCGGNGAERDPKARTGVGNTGAVG